MLHCNLRGADVDRKLLVKSTLLARDLPSEEAEVVLALQDIICHHLLA